MDLDEINDDQKKSPGLSPSAYIWEMLSGKRRRAAASARSNIAIRNH
jgi:hypothetical protein